MEHNRICIFLVFPYLFTVTVNSPSRADPYSSTLSSSLEKIVRVLVGEHLPSMAKAIVANVELRKFLLIKFLDLVDEESSELCRKSTVIISSYSC